MSAVRRLAAEPYVRVGALHIIHSGQRPLLDELPEALPGAREPVETGVCLPNIEEPPSPLEERQAGPDTEEPVFLVRQEQTSSLRHTTRRIHPVTVHCVIEIENPVKARETELPLQLVKADTLGVDGLPDGHQGR